jgi:hypothetical protein
MTSTLKRELADLWVSILNTDAKRLFGHDAALLRTKARDDKIAQPGYVGSRYRRGGLLFVGMNPGGRAGQMTDADRDQLPILKRLRESSPHNRVERFDELNTELSRSMKHWSICRPVISILEALEMDFQKIAYINLLKWRTKGERVTSRLLNQSWDSHTAAQVALLRPAGVISLGVGTGDAVNRVWNEQSFNCVIPRSRGDRGCPPQQKEAISRTIRFLRRQGMGPR